MNWRFWQRAKPAEVPEPLPLIDPSAFQAIAKAPVLNPNGVEQLGYAAYRLDAIARCVEQRREDGDLHPEHDDIVAEAMIYGWMLVRAGKWTYEELRVFAQRLTPPE